MKNAEQRDSYIDIVKGLGIISIVIGHASWNIRIFNINLQIGPFVYLYHLAIFLFCSGYLYNENITDFWFFVGKKLKSLYKPFVFWSILYLLLRNFFIAIGIISGSYFTFSEWIVSLANIITFNGVGELLGAFWFIPMMFFAISFFSFFMIVTQKFDNDLFRQFVRIIIFMTIGVLGILSVDNHLGLLCNIQVSCLMVPVIALGYYFRKNCWNKYLHLFGFLGALCVMVWMLRQDIGIIELSRFMIINKWLFYPITACGIYFVLFLAKMISKISEIDKFFSMVGKYSFEIMALHFTVFKFIDLIVCISTGKMDVLDKFPRSFDELWPVYYVLGVIMPILLMKALDWFKGKVNDKIPRVNKEKA